MVLKKECSHKHKYEPEGAVMVGNKAQRFQGLEFLSRGHPASKCWGDVMQAGTESQQAAATYSDLASLFNFWRQQAIPNNTQ